MSRYTMKDAQERLAELGKAIGVHTEESKTAAYKATEHGADRVWVLENAPQYGGVCIQEIRAGSTGEDRPYGLYSREPVKTFCLMVDHTLETIRIMRYADDRDGTPWTRNTVVSRDDLGTGIGYALSKIVTPRVLTEADVTFTLEVEQDDSEVRGNAIASGDADLDTRIEDELIRRLDNGDVWAWASVRVVATWESMDGNKYEGDDYLGACSYEDESDFVSTSGYYEDMKAEALNQLNKQIESDWKALSSLTNEA